MTSLDPESPQYDRFSVVENDGHTEQRTLRSGFLTTKDALAWARRSFSESEARDRRMAICGVGADGYLSLSLDDVAAPGLVLGM